MNDFIKDLEDDIENAIFISGFRALLSLEDYMMEWDQFFNEMGAPSLNDAFKDAFLNGTIMDPNGLTEKMSIITDNTFSNWTTKMKDQANKNGIRLNFTINSVSVTQTEPFMVDISINLDISIQDKKNTASWPVDKTYTKKINITGLVDPLYLVNTDGVANNTIRETIYSNWPADLSAHLSNAHYRKHTDAPNYLMRFENDLGSDSNGIESLVTDRLKDEGLSVSPKSAVDFIYFDSASTTVDCNVNEIVDTDFYLDFSPDPSHKDFYLASCAGT